METPAVSGVQEWTLNKKIIVFSTVGIALGLSVTAGFVPSAREGILSVVKVLLDYVKVFL